MASNQQFCLRWNNHQSTLISVFDHLLESGTLVDCTLAAEGQFLKAHKVVLSACSPYLEALLSQHYEKHPILILKDVTFHELKSMLDYMYKGEVNITQEQLGTFLKAAESLQIKGLTDCGAINESQELDRSREMDHARTPIQGELNRLDRSLAGIVPKRIDIRKQIPILPRPRSPLVGLSSNFMINSDHRRVNKQSLSQDLATSNIRNREGSLSPTVKRKRPCPTNYGLHNDDPNPTVPPIENNVDQNHQEKDEKSKEPSPVLQNLSSTGPATGSVSDVKKQSESENSVDSEVIKREVKTENLDFTDEVQNEDSVEDLTVDEEEEEMDEMVLSRPGPSNVPNSLVAGVPWHIAGEGNGDDGLLAAQQDSQDEDPPTMLSKNFPSSKIKHRVGVLCSDCGSGTKSSGVVMHKGTCPKLQSNKHFRCQCGDIFSTQKLLTIHRVACGTPRPAKPKHPQFKCKCGKNYKSSNALNIHITTCKELNGSMPKVVCDKCGRICKSSQGLSNHRRVCTTSYDTPDEIKLSPRDRSKIVKVVQTQRNKPIVGIKCVEGKDTKSNHNLKNAEKSKCETNVDVDDRSNDEDNVLNEKVESATNSMNIAKEIIKDFHSEPPSPKNNRQMILGDFSRTDKSDGEEDEYYRHVPSSPVSAIHDTTAKVGSFHGKSPDNETKTASNSCLSVSPKNKSRSNTPRTPLQNSVGENFSGTVTRTASIIQKFSCKCGRSFKTRNGYRTHKLLRCKKKMERCYFCSFRSSLNNAMKNHVLECHKDVLNQVFGSNSSE